MWPQLPMGTALRYPEQLSCTQVFAAWGVLLLVQNRFGQGHTCGKWGRKTRVSLRLEQPGGVCREPLGAAA